MVNRLNERMGTSDMLSKLIEFKKQDDLKGFSNFFNSFDETQLNELLELSQVMQNGCEIRLILKQNEVV